jgi:hypothetical protein
MAMGLDLRSPMRNYSIEDEDSEVFPHWNVNRENMETR